MLAPLDGVCSSAPRVPLFGVLTGTPPMRRRYCLLLFVWLSVAAERATAQPAVVKQNVNLRAGPSSTSALRRTLYPGDELTLLHPDTTNRYVEVRTAAGNEGWVYVPRI